MICTEEAKKRTQNNRNSYVEEELSKIEKLISEAINKGEFSILGDERLHDLTIQRLEELGYQVQSGCHYNEPYYSVKWE